MKVDVVLGYKNENVFYGGPNTYDQMLFFRSENKVISEYFAREITCGIIWKLF